MKNDQNLKQDDIKKEAPIMVQVIILALICFIGELLAAIVPINCSSPVYDFIIVFLLLQLKIIKLEWIEKTRNCISA